MKYHRSNAKKYARQNITEIWGASFTPFTTGYNIDEEPGDTTSVTTSTTWSSNACSFVKLLMSFGISRL